MKLVTYYTKTHEILFEDYFINSLKNYNEFEILSSTGSQHSISGDYFSAGFNETTKDKIDFLLNVLETSCSEDEMVLFSDVDIIFIKPVKDYLSSFNDFDFVFQNGIGGLNTGFFIVKNNELSKNLLRDVIEKCHIYDNDQLALNALIGNHNVKFKMFGDEILSFAHLFGPKVWSGEKFNVPENTLIFHACWCAGIDNKIKLLDYVRDNTKIKA
jgi:hypothetical protein